MEHSNILRLPGSLFSSDQLPYEQQQFNKWKWDIEQRVTNIEHLNKHTHKSIKDDLMHYLDS